MTVPFASIATSPGGIEGKMGGSKSLAKRSHFRGEQLPDLIECLQIRDGIGAGRATDGLLIDKPDAAQMFKAFNGTESSHGQRGHSKRAGHRPIERLLDQRAFA